MATSIAELNIPQGIAELISLPDKDLKWHLNNLPISKYMKDLLSKEPVDRYATLAQLSKLATDYKSYMEFRAQKEKSAHKLDHEFYFLNLIKGCPFFFGVYHNETKLVNDQQKPKFFKEWKKLVNYI